jgi:hypothetical protein
MIKITNDLIIYIPKYIINYDNIVSYMESKS